MRIDQVADIIHKISEGFEDACLDCLDRRFNVIELAIKEQLYSGQDGQGKHLEPTYDNDPFFSQPGYWHNRARAYKAWKKSITPPIRGTMLGLDPRPDEVPNLYIDGTFYSKIAVGRKGNVIDVDPGDTNGPEIVSKYGEKILTLGPRAVEYINQTYLLEAIGDFFEKCGYK